MAACITWDDLTISTSFESDISVQKIDDIQTQVCASWKKGAALNCEKPHLELSWSLPLRDIEYEWYPGCGKNHALRVDWNGPIRSRISSGAPVFCFYDTAGYSRMTVALSDVLSEIFWSLGVREEDGTLKCVIRIPLDATDLTHEYHAILYRNHSPIRFAEALRKVSLWWETINMARRTPPPRQCCSLAGSPSPTGEKPFPTKPFPNGIKQGRTFSSTCRR